MTSYSRRVENYFKKYKSNENKREREMPNHKSSKI
jgi:hypothetical protein